MLRLFKPSLGPIGLAFAVSASAMMLAPATSEAAVETLKNSIKHQPDHAAPFQPAASMAGARAEQHVAQQSGAGEPNISVQPDNASPGAQEASKPDAADVINSSGDAPAKAEPSTISATGEPPTTPVTDEPPTVSATGEPTATSAPENSTSSSAPQPKAAERDAQPAAASPSPTSEQKSAVDAEPPTGARQSSADDGPDDAAPRTTSAKNEPKPVKQHPLAAAQPGMDVIVCEAGCTNASEMPNVVYSQPTTARTATSSVAEMQPNSTATAAEQDPMKDMIVCLGGCYDTPKFYRSALVSPDRTAGSWTATVVPTSAKPDDAGSGEWMRRIDERRKTEATKPEKK